MGMMLCMFIMSCMNIMFFMVIAIVLFAFPAGVAVLGGKLTYPAVGEALGLEWEDPYGVWG